MGYFRIQYNPIEICRTVITERLTVLGISFSMNAQGALRVHGKLTDENRLQIDEALKPYGISLIEKESENMVEGIKYAIEELLDSPAVRTEKVSAYLSEKLGYSYSSLANRFSEETYTSIENFVILRRIEHAKNLMLLGGISLTEIAHKLDYSSVAHLSRQFKKTTGLTPTTFLRIIEKRKTPDSPNHTE
ncbi:transcriptional regulator, AraC family [Pricia antarctica]|uniref:Transcriptional regulator, AraC family n=1 Tax=Pricia antarctica TaxID=641691 RepID=A0A1G7GB28_9FLAO|nr:helix-turn-helix domain-containing protein [Pricia antarctica]SDE85348.1 transcriptional regulator, AraC family [Pricia antarctica]